MTAPHQAEPSDELSRRLTDALATAPAVQVPQTFAARTARAAAQLPAPTANLRFSRLTIQYTFAAILLAMLGFAARSHSLSTGALAVEMLLAVELAALGTWLALRTQS